MANEFHIEKKKCKLKAFSSELVIAKHLHRISFGDTT